MLVYLCLSTELEEVDNDSLKSTRCLQSQLWVSTGSQHTLGFSRLTCLVRMPELLSVLLLSLWA